MNVAYSAQIRGMFCSNRSGPGVMPFIMKTPSTMAVTVSPGRPSDNAGIQALATAALLLLVPASTTRWSLSSSGVVRIFCTLVATQAPMSAPAPGKKPTTIPRSEERATSHRSRRINTRGWTKKVCPGRAGAGVCSMRAVVEERYRCSSTSENPKSPIMTTM